MFKTLSRENRNVLAEGVYIDQLPQTFRDAIQVAGKLGISYLWIDALCIIQDDQDDWSRESVTMAKIYTYSVVNISAAASDHAGGRLPSQQRDPRGIDWQSLRD